MFAFPLECSSLTQGKGMHAGQPRPTLNVNPSSLNPSDPDFDGNKLAGVNILVANISSRTFFGKVECEADALSLIWRCIIIANQVYVSPPCLPGSEMSH